MLFCLMISCPDTHLLYSVGNFATPLLSELHPNAYRPLSRHYPNVKKPPCIGRKDPQLMGVLGS